MTPTKAKPSKAKAKSELFIELDGHHYPVTTVSRGEIEKLLIEFKVGKFHVMQNGVQVRPSELERGVSAKIVRIDKAQ